jgi:transcriptional regulator with XRE-family HTH domain
MNTATQDFGRRLRLQRERRGISLDAISASTKIARSLLGDLERGDLSKWPGGIYRRAFMREYAAIIGVPADPVLAEFFELFPEEGMAAASTGSESADLRLTFAEDRVQEVIRNARRLLFAALELGVILAAGWVIAYVTAAGFWTISGSIALVYYPLAAASFTRTPAFRWQRFKPVFPAPAEASEPASSQELIQLVLPRSAVRGADERTA